MFGVDTAIAADKESDWQSQNSSVKFASLGIAHYYRIIQLELLVEVADGFRTIVHGNANNLQALILIFILQFHKMRDFFPAGIAPGCPEVQQNHLAPIVRKTQLLSTQLRKGEVGSQRVLGDGGADASPPVMMGDKIESSDDDDRRDTRQNSVS